MSGRWILVGAAALLACCLVNANVQAGLVDVDTSYASLESWNGFGADFSPEWVGDTTVVSAWENLGIIKPSEWISDSGCICGYLYNGHTSLVALNYDPGHWESRPTVRKVSSSSDNEVSTAAWLRVNGQEYTSIKNDDGDAELARYARLVSPQDELLAESSAIAYRNTNFGDDEFSAEGRVSAAAILTAAAKEASADSSGSSWLKAKYELDKDTDFSLELDIAIRGQVDFSFTATDVNSGEVAFFFNELSGAINKGTQRKISMDGTLEAGKYEFALNCSTDAAVNSLGQWNPGGQATFDVSLDLKEEYVQVWVPGSGYDFDSDCVYSFNSCCVYSNENLQHSSSTAPEPSTSVMLVLGTLCCMIAGRLRRKSA